MSRLARKMFQRLFDANEDSQLKQTLGTGGADAAVTVNVPGTNFPGTEEILSGMSPEEKIRVISGFHSFAVPPVPSAGLPPVWMSDATAGVRLFGGGTAFPCPLAMAATWNHSLVRDVATAIGYECRARGVSILLGPGVNICRLPTGGRNFEYFGEDPFLAGTMATAYITGTRRAGVESVVKHFACNNSEYDRHRENAVVDERTLREMYLPAFRMAVTEGAVRFVMSAYNQINGTYASEHRRLLMDILRDEWGFDGAVMSDWTSTYSTVPAIKNGLDLEMPSAKRFSLNKIRRELQRGTVTEEDLDRMAAHILSACGDSGLYAGLPGDRGTSSGDRGAPAVEETARRAAAEGMVLLKNNGILPLRREGLRRIVVTGSMAEHTATGGGGSSFVKPKKAVDILEGIRRTAGPGTEVVFLDRKSRFRGRDRGIIASADAVIVCIGYDRTYESEGYDRLWRIPYGGDRLVREAARLNPSVVTLLTGGGAMETASWMDSAAGIVHTFYLGEYGGDAAAGLLFGDINPSGRLPVSMPEKLEDVPAMHHYRRKPWRTTMARIIGPQGIKGVRKIRDVVYGEGLSVGYRGYHPGGPAPCFPFGYGLSYTSFEYSDLRVTPGSCAVGDLLNGLSVKVMVNVENTGSLSGTEVVQIYVRDVESSLPRPLKELKGFSRVTLEPGERKQISVKLDDKAFSFYDDTIGAWVVEPGEFRVMACRNAGTVELEEGLIIKDL